MDEPYIINNNDLLKQLIHRIENKIPTSAIRKSDGENVVLAFGVIDSIPPKKYLKKLKHFNIHSWNLGFQLFLRGELIKAFTHCNYLGISRPEMRRKYWAAELEILEYFEFKNGNYCDLDFHTNFIKLPDELKLKNPLAEKIISSRKIGIISYRDVSELINHFNSEIVFSTAIPRRRARFQTMNKEKFINVIRQISENINKVDVWLIGAGVYAKPFCEHIRREGGIGIDIGSSIDTWVNDYKTRKHLRRVYDEFKNQTDVGKK